MTDDEDVREIRLRKHDKLNDFASDLNNLIQKYNQGKGSTT